MTGTSKIEENMAETDKIESHYRHQLSALMDGALPPEEARFLLRRLQHDAELAQCLDRWHMAGDALRGEGQAILPAGFAERVAAAISAEPALVAAASSSRPMRWNAGLRWGSGAALAASVALVALFVARQASGPDAIEAPSSVATSVESPAAPAIAVDTPVAVAGTVVAPVFTATTPALATASVPRRNTGSSRRNTTRSQSQRAVIRTPARAERPMVAAAAMPRGDASSTNDVFDNTTAASSRPWPSAALPQTPVAGSFTVDYGNASSPSFYPFEPRMPDAQRASETPPVDDAPKP